MALERLLSMFGYSSMAKKKQNTLIDCFRNIIRNKSNVRKVENYNMQSEIRYSQQTKYI